MAPPADEAERERVAILLCHGMGQQVQFETLDSVARAVRDTAQTCGTWLDRAITVSLHPNETKFLGRAEMFLRKPSGEIVEAHFYEAYWAPLTEGRVTLKETLSFLLDAAHRGLGFAYHRGVFDRRIFCRETQFEIPAHGIFQLGVASWILLLVSVAFTTLALAPLLKAVDIIRGTGNAELAATIAISFAIAVCVLFFGGVIIVAARFARARIDSEVGTVPPAMWKRRAMVLSVVAVILASAALMTFVGVLMYRWWITVVIADPRLHPLMLIGLLAAFFLEFLILRRFVQGFLIEFVGDVAAYLSPFKVSKFEEIRHAIQDRAREVAKFIYTAGKVNRSERAYNRVFLVGHSLGSVLAYDTINDALNRDEHASGWDAKSHGSAYTVLERTKLLLTFGSPLDKTAFIFRTQTSSEKFDVREALAAAVQPLIDDPKKRRLSWVNIWSPSDWVSGKLEYYDLPASGAKGRVQNIVNKASWQPWNAHTEYWSKPLFPSIVHQALTGVPSPKIDKDTQKSVDAALEGVFQNR